MGGSKLKNIIGVRFKKLGKIYFFNPKGLKVKKGDNVIVETPDKNVIKYAIAIESLPCRL